ncbi:hypothetical protein NCU16723 [Neurospora crassa OR74A]|uniref:Uncharacterized protein n=1 Tax=Neurospora crassa (strain ATCC 24698 / 74-OR23-1A / CBS 708.71 / DSM 1257 / FGSC 987) TaxID=367110 RepID=V5ILU2_NEUCR|nr:hypothetical protein NCU16723 [Neurospora crassa OR74A]ESA42753.1 hypothetical protein NCU16723 [Neurospora crassa OR74A]|eukprot:XP_011394354.1 hypothetical protein NCU16723 [Neurospora crassa OR74A]
MYDNGLIEQGGCTRPWNETRHRMRPAAYHSQQPIDQKPGWELEWPSLPEKLRRSDNLLGKGAHDGAHRPLSLVFLNAFLTGTRGLLHGETARGRISYSTCSKSNRRRRRRRFEQSP